MDATLAICEGSCSEIRQEYVAGVTCYPLPCNNGYICFDILIEPAKFCSLAGFRMVVCIGAEMMKLMKASHDFVVVRLTLEMKCMVVFKLIHIRIRSISNIFTSKHKNICKSLL